MTTPAGLSDAECDAIIERTMQTANERDWVDRTLVRAAYAAGQAASVPRVCAWALDDPDSGTWATSCGNLWLFNDEGPKENGVEFCPYCGGKCDPSDEPLDYDADAAPAVAQGEKE